MGREIRRVPANWQHPKHVTRRLRRGEYSNVYVWRPLLDRDFAAEMAAWQEGFEKWAAGDRPDGSHICASYDDWAGSAPDFVKSEKWFPSMVVVDGVCGDARSGWPK